MQTVVAHENRVDSFFLTRTQSSEISNFDIIFAISEKPWRWGYLDTPPPAFVSDWKDDITNIT